MAHILIDETIDKLRIIALIKASNNFSDICNLKIHAFFLKSRASYTISIDYYFLRQLTIVCFLILFQCFFDKSLHNNASIFSNASLFLIFRNSIYIIRFSFRQLMNSNSWVMLRDLLIVRWAKTKNWLFPFINYKCPNDHGFSDKWKIQSV